MLKNKNIFFIECPKNVDGRTFKFWSSFSERDRFYMWFGAEACRPNVLALSMIIYNFSSLRGARPENAKVMYSKSYF